MLPRFASVLVAGLLTTLALAGCVDLPDRDDGWDESFPHIRDHREYPSEPEPLEYTYFRIGQETHGGPTPIIYQGTLVYHFCVHNPNNFTVQPDAGWNIYQVTGPPDAGEMRLVAKSEARSYLGAKGTGGENFPYHDVYYNETLEGRSVEYVIHIWHEVPTFDGPIHRQDRWFNHTFIPNGPASTSHIEGERCEIWG